MSLKAHVSRKPGLRAAVHVCSFSKMGVEAASRIRWKKVLPRTKFNKAINKLEFCQLPCIREQKARIQNSQEAVSPNRAPAPLCAKTSVCLDPFGLPGTFQKEEQSSIPTARSTLARGGGVGSCPCLCWRCTGAREHEHLHERGPSLDDGMDTTQGEKPGPSPRPGPHCERTSGPSLLPGCPCLSIIPALQARPYE